MKILRIIFLFLSVVLLLVSAMAGMLMNYLYVFLLISVAIMMVALIVSIVKKQVHWKFSNVQSVRAYLLQALLRNVVWIVTGFCVYVAVVPIQFTPSDFTAILITIWGSVITLCVLDWIPRQQTGKSVNLTLTVFLIFLIYQLAIAYSPPRGANSVNLVPPFNGDWYVLQGGNSALINHHHFAGSQKYAVDFMVADDGVLPADKTADIKQYRTFGKDVYSPVDGVVVAVQHSLPDQKPGLTDHQNLAGNHIVVKTENDIYLLIAHLKNNSVLVAEGDSIKVGQELAKVGNSGNTTQPHLHIQAMSKADLLNRKNKPIPISFRTDDDRSRFLKRNDVVRGLNLLN